MQDRAIETLKEIFPESFSENSCEHLEDDDWVFPGIDDPFGGDLTDTEETIINEILDGPDVTSDDFDSHPLDVLPENIIERIRERDRLSDVFGPESEMDPGVGIDYPGSPGGIVDTGTTASPKPITLPSPEVLAFYLPYHQFPLKWWGIYILLEGTLDLANDLIIISGYRLSRRDAFVAARAYLFHHEAYHNAVEVFASRMEVMHRQPCFIGGFRGLYMTPTIGITHEEELATAYGIRKIGKSIFKGNTLSADLAKSCLTLYMRGCSPVYAKGTDHLSPRKYKTAERSFQEIALTTSCPSVSKAHHDIWSAATYSMAPSVRRGGRALYVTHRKSPLYARARLSHVYFKRRNLIKNLRKVVGGEERGGGRHPKFVLHSGIAIPVPGHRVLPLAFLAPEIIDKILVGQKPEGLTVKKLKRLGSLPSDWDSQKKLLRINL